MKLTDCSTSIYCWCVRLHVITLLHLIHPFLSL